MRDFRDRVEELLASRTFELKVTPQLQIVKMVIAEGEKNKDYVDGSISLEGSFYYNFGSNGGFRNMDVFRVALEEIKKLETILAESPKVQVFSSPSIRSTDCR
jgi:hypothetical protein